MRNIITLHNGDSQKYVRFKWYTFFCVAKKKNSERYEQK